MGTDGSYYAFDPQPRSVIISTIRNEIPASDVKGQKGIYAEETVKQWLDQAYLMTYAESIAVSHNVKGENGETIYDASDALQMTYDLANQNKANIEGWLIGLNWDRIGGRCSIAVVTATASYLLYGLVMFASRAMIIYGGGDYNIAISAVKAAFSQLYLLTESIKRRKDENQRPTSNDIESNGIELPSLPTRNGIKEGTIPTAPRPENVQRNVDEIRVGGDGG